MARRKIITLGTRIREFLVAREMTQAELARRVGVDNSAVHKWLSGGNPKFSHLEKIAAAFGVAVHELTDPDHAPETSAQASG